MQYGVNPTFNVADLVPYKGPVVEPNEEIEPLSTLESEPIHPPSAQRHQHGQIDRILDEQITVTKN